MKEKDKKKIALDGISRPEAQKILARQINDSKTVQNIEKVIIRIKKDNDLK